MGLQTDPLPISLQFFEAAAFSHGLGRKQTLATGTEHQISTASDVAGDARTLRFDSDSGVRTADIEAPRKQMILHQDTIFRLTDR